MQRYSVVITVKHGTVPNVHKSQMQDTTSYQVKKLKTQCFCKTCIQPTKLAVMENKNIEEKIMEHTEKLSQQTKVVETGLQKKADTTELEKLQKRVERSCNPDRSLLGFAHYM